MKKMATRLACCAGLLLGGLAFLPACSGPVEAVEASPPADPLPLGVEPISEHPDPVVTMSFDDDKRVELYEIEGAVLIMEIGKAEGSSVSRRMPEAFALLKANHYVEAFAAMQPGRPVPQALLDLQARHPEIEAAPREKKAVAGTQDPVATRLGGGNEPISIESTCSNNCCNWDWLVNNICGSGAPISWFYYDYGWSWENVSTVTYLDAIACAISGTSQFTLNMTDGSGGSWSVEPGWYADWHWGGTPTPWSMSSTVNSRTNQHAHTYCGDAG